MVSDVGSHDVRNQLISSRQLRDTTSFQGLQYFIQRYLSDAALDLEFRHLWKLYEDLTGHKTPLIIIDSIGIDSRRKSLFAKVHGRYYTIGFIDVRAVSPYLIPMFSSNYRSTDSEAMNVIEIVNQAKSVLGRLSQNDLTLYNCDGNCPD